MRGTGTVREEKLCAGGGACGGGAPPLGPVSSCSYSVVQTGGDATRVHPLYVVRASRGGDSHRKLREHGRNNQALRAGARDWRRSPGLSHSSEMAKNMC